MGIPVRTTGAQETGTLGCAIAAATACGDYPDVASAAREMTQLSDAVNPIEKNVAIYNRKYAIYEKTIAALDSVWDDFQHWQGDEK